MNYSRGLQPSCCSKGEYEAENRKRWHSVKDNPPANGQCVVALHMNGTNDTDFWTTQIAYYCDGGFYCLEYDPTLGVLRKVYISEPVEYWSNYYTFSVEEILS